MRKREDLRKNTTFFSITALVIQPQQFWLLQSIIVPSADEGNSGVRSETSCDREIVAFVADGAVPGACMTS